MPDMVTITSEEIKRLKERAEKCAMDKSYLQLVIRLMNRVSAASGLEDTVECMLANITDVIGGTNIILYYWQDGRMFSADVYGNNSQEEVLEDGLVQQVIATHEPVEVELQFEETRMLTPEFTKAYTWVYPLLVGSDLIGVFKLENLHIGVRNLYAYLPTFFSFAALVLRNEIIGHTRLKEAYDRLAESNAELEQEVEERVMVEEELRQARDELEERIAGRTAELRNVNQRLEQELAERIRTEEALLVLVAEKNLLSSIVQTSDDAIIAKDLDGTILSWNHGAERIYGYKADEAIGRNISMLFSPDQPSELPDIMAKVRRGERVEHYVTKRMRKDGKSIFISLTMSPIKNAAGTITGASAIARDITHQMVAEEDVRRLNVELEQRVSDRTRDLEVKRIELENSQKALMNIVEDLNFMTDELKEANNRLKELDRLKSMFIASMSHELRTPLNSIIGFSSILHDEWLGPVNSEQKENLATIQRSGKHLLTLINDVIDVSKIEAGKIDVHFEEFDLYEILWEAVQLLEKDIRGKGLELNLKLEHHTICSDKRRLLQCVINLISNAYKFTERGSIFVGNSTELMPAGGYSNQREPWAVIVVRDTGIGIVEEDITRLFQPFVRLDSHIKATVPGTGLGLYLTRKLVDDVLRGDILCSSSIGLGSVFTMRIPERINEKSVGYRG